jgi:peptide/nickel transport system substrate-binding protein
VNDSRVNRLFAVARSGQMSRRQLLETGLKLGLASPVILSLIDPHYTYSEIASAIALLVYDMLIILRGDSTDEFDPRLAESWEVSDDQTTFTFHLYPDVTFHDGTPANAQAVKDSYTRWIELGGSPVNVITRFVESPDQMEVVDDVTLRFNLSGPEPLFLAAMASSYGPMVISPTAIAENATEDDPYAHLWAQQFAIGSGPYLLESNSLNEGIVLSRFENYRHGWEGNHFDQVVFRVVPENATRRQLIESGEADGTANNLTVDDLVALRENPAVQVIEYASTFVNWTIMNAPRLMTPEVRQGFSYAFPYDDVQNSVYQGLLQRSGPIPDGVRGFDPDVFLYQTDLERAKDLILGGGFAEGDTFEYMTDANLTTAQTVAQLFQANVAEMGFNLEIISVDYSTIESTIYGDAPAEERPHFIAPWGWWPDYNDPWNQLWPNFTEANIGGGGSNGGYWLNPRFEEIMAEAENYEDEERLQELMIEAQNILTELDPPAIYLGQVLRYVVLGADIQGFVPNPLYLDSYNVYDMSRASS